MSPITTNSHITTALYVHAYASLAGDATNYLQRPCKQGDPAIETVDPLVYLQESCHGDLGPWGQQSGLAVGAWKMHHSRATKS